MAKFLEIEDTEKESRVKWNEDELSKLAKKWVELRIAKPFEGIGALFEEAQRKVLDGDRQRSIVSVTACKPLALAIGKEWRGKMDLIQKSMAPAEVQEPEVRIITLEVPRKLTVQEMLAGVDEAALEGLLAAKRIQREIATQSLLLAIASKAGATDLPKVPTYTPHSESFAASHKGPPRIAVVNMPANQNELLLAEMKLARLEANIRFPDHKDKDTVARCDFAIICRSGSTKNGADGDRAIGQLGRERVILHDGYEVPSLIQAVRNITARQ